MMDQSISRCLRNVEDKPPIKIMILYQDALDYLYEQETFLDCQGFSVNPDWSEDEVIKIATQMGWKYYDSHKTPTN